MEPLSHRTRPQGLDHPPTLQGLRVLVVEDDADQREFMSALLAAAGAQVRAAATVARALQTLAAWRPDVLVSDLGLPDDSGYRLIAQVRSIAGPAELPAVAVTGRTSLADRVHALRAGFQLHLGKPVDPDHLLQAIGRFAAPWHSDRPR